MPGHPCCCSKCETCTCEACSDSPFSAPCCWKVVISGIVDGSCVDCEELNKTYFLSQVDDGSSYTPEGCSWFEGAVCGDCDPTDIWLTVFQEGGDYIIEVTMDGHVWRKNYGTSKPECCGLKNETIPHATNSGDCDSSSATCVITALADGHPCNTAACIFSCESCNAPEEIAIDLTSLGLTDDECAFCDQITGVFVLTLNTIIGSDTDCTWGYCGPEVCSVFSPGESKLDFRITLRVATGGGFPFWQLFIDIGLAIGCGVVHSPTPHGLFITYVSDTWGLLETDCMILQDDNGDVTVDIDGLVFMNGCIGPPAATLKFSDANA